jgi:hypothetical protein
MSLIHFRFKKIAIKKKWESRWFMPVILATQEAELRRIGA